MASFLGRQEFIFDGETFTVGFHADYSGEHKITIGEVEVQDIYRKDESELPMGSLWMDIAQHFRHGEGIEEALIELAEKDRKWDEDRKIKDRILGRR